MKQLSFDEFLKQQEATEQPYFNGEGMPLPWETPPLAIDVEKNRDSIGLSENRNETFRARTGTIGGEVPALFYGKNIKRQSHANWKTSKSRYPKRYD